jgi:hypothetical protein
MPAAVVPTLRPYSDGAFDFSSTSLIAGGAISLLVAIAAFVLIQGVATAALTRAIADNYLGESTSFLDAYRRIGRSWMSLLGALLVASLYAIAISLWLLAVGRAALTSLRTPAPNYPSTGYQPRTFCWPRTFSGAVMTCTMPMNWPSRSYRRFVVGWSCPCLA